MIILAYSLGFAAEEVDEFWRWYWLKKGNCSAIIGKFPNLRCLRPKVRPQTPQIRGFSPIAWVVTKKVSTQSMGVRCFFCGRRWPKKNTTFPHWLS